MSEPVERIIITKDAKPKLASVPAKVSIGIRKNTSVIVFDRKIVTMNIIITIIISRIRRADNNCFCWEDRRNNIKIKDTGII